MNSREPSPCCIQPTLPAGKLGFRPPVLLLLLLLVSNAQAALLFYEGFDYARGEQLGETAITSSRWENDKDQFTIVAGSLDYARIHASTGNRLNVASTSQSLDSVRTAPGAWASQSNGTLYVSFLLRVESIKGIGTNGAGTSVLTISKTSNNSELLGINLLNDGGVKLGVLK